MASVALELIRPFTAVAAANVPVPILDHEIREAAIHFCERTRAWKDVVTLDVVAAQAEYTLTVPTDGTVVIVEEVYFNQARLEAKPMDTLKEQYQDWLTASGTPLFYTQQQPGVLTLVPIPASALEDGLLVRLTYKPSRTATTIPDWLYEQWADVLGWGALSRLLMNPGLPCHNPNLAAVYQTQYDAGLLRAIRQTGKNFTRAPNRVRAYF
jgi:hypothetical protein